MSRHIAPRGSDQRLRVKDFERECLWGKTAPVSPNRSRLLGVCDRCYYRAIQKQPRLLDHTACNRRLDFRKADTD